MTTKPITGLTLNINDQGEVTLAAADAEAEGHLWAINGRPISLSQLNEVALILGPDAVEGVKGRLKMIIDRAQAKIDRLEQMKDEARAAEALLTRLKEELQ